MGEIRNGYKMLVEKPDEDVCVYVMIILKRILKKYGG
jgi:hypothetical protein